ncbi:hypothetical protein C5167_046872 [Papaver somniferum]|uniref:Uncharacterized protein n=1 Tax=Papaver somniferum TaxID=3469 RepID=A0A4Y7LF15_PAPSO|nr:hypothetical protein C5167_046872 [Papaver somniferum]
MVVESFGVGIIVLMVVSPLQEGLSQVPAKAKAAHTDVYGKEVPILDNSRGVTGLEDLVLILRNTVVESEVFEKIINGTWFHLIPSKEMSCWVLYELLGLFVKSCAVTLNEAYNDDSSVETHPILKVETTSEGAFRRRFGLEELV